MSLSAIMNAAVSGLQVAQALDHAHGEERDDASGDQQGDHGHADQAQGVEDGAGGVLARHPAFTIANTKGVFDLASKR